MSKFNGLCLLIPFCLVLFFHDLTAADLWSSHEARAAQNAQCMLDDGDWDLPHLFDGQVELQKPPAFYWMVAGVAKLRGMPVDRWAVRLPAALAALLTVILIWNHLTAQGRPVAGLIAAAALAGSIHFTSLARTGRIDMPLTAAITAALLLLNRSPRTVTVILASAAMAVALLLKGPVGIALPLSVIGFWQFSGRWRDDVSDRRMLMAASLCAAAGAIIALPWFMSVNEKTSGEFFRVFFLYHNMQRALGDAPNLATHPWWYYIPRFAIDFCPWTPLLCATLWRFAVRPDIRSDRQAAFGLVWLTVTVGVLSLAQFKRADYLLPAFPGAALFVGCVAERWLLALSERKRRLTTIAFGLLLFGTVAGWEWFHQIVEPRQQAPREQSAFAARARQRAPVPQTLLLFRVESHLLTFHLGRPIHTLVEWGELNERLAEPGTHWFVTRAEFVTECLDKVRTRRIEVADRSADFVATTPLRPLVLMRTIDEPPTCPTNESKD